MPIIVIDVPLPSAIVVTTLSLALLVLVGCGGGSRIGEGDGPLPGEGIEVQWGVIENVLGGENRFRSELIIRNQGTQTLPDEGWALFFNFGRMIDTATVTPLVDVDHINGDFYRMRPTAEFAPIAPGSRTRITFTSSAWAINETDAPDGFYFVWGDEETGRVDPVGDAVALPFTMKNQVTRARGDQVPLSTADLRYEENATLHEMASEEVPKILPRPNSAAFSGGNEEIDGGHIIAYASGLANEAGFLSDALAEVLDSRPQTAIGETGDLVLALDTSLASGAYRLTISEEGVHIAGGDASAVFYGIQSLRALIPPEAYAGNQTAVQIPRGQVVDAPRFPYRGMHLDVARNFQSVEAVKQVLDLMAFYKLNKFHFHLTDDEGWRLSIEELPELTAVGGRRGHTLSQEEHLSPHLGSGPLVDESPGSGFYTREEFKDILQYAHERHIEVIPEVDLPGHARAAIVAMEARARKTGSDAHLISDPLDASEYRSVQMFADNVVNVCMPSTYDFLETVVDDVVEMYDEADVPFRALHTGGDEVPEGVWEESPACEELIRRSDAVDDVADLHDYFLRRFDQILDQYGLVTAGWEEIALQERNGRHVPNPAFVGAGFRPYVWNAVWGWGGEENAYRLANAGYDVVLSNASNFYFDLAMEKHPQEPGMYWAGFVSMKAPFAFIPFDLYKTAEADVFGRPIADTTYARHERLTLVGRDRILGLQGQLWSETITSTERLEYMLLPRIIALAERSWAERPRWALMDDRTRRDAALDHDWNLFANALGQRELPRLDRWQVNYRIPPPGAVIENDVLKANVALPGLTIRYTLDGSEPTTESPIYTGPIRVESSAKLKTFNTSGRGSRTVTVESTE